MKKYIAVLLTVHNRKDKTLACLTKLFGQQFNSSEYSINVFMTDDGCTDGTSEIVKHKYPSVNIIYGDGTLFWNRGMRKAWVEASKHYPDFYLWINDDTELFDDSVTRILNFSSMLNDQSIVVGSTYNSIDEKILSYGGRFKQRNYPFVYPDEVNLKKCDTFNGNFVLIPKYVFDVVGFNDFYFHHSFGDFDYGLNAGRKGISSFVAPGFFGYCKRNNPIPLFRRKSYSLIKRYKLLYSPLGFNPIEDFHMNRKNYSLFKCIWYFIKLHINVLFPKDHLKYC